MCGIAAIVKVTPGAGPVLRPELETMADALEGRGPDACGIWVDESGAVGIVNRRLSTQDSRPEADQPLWSHDGRAVVVLNGEIYNHIELRKELEALGCVFRTKNDAEVLANAYRTWGRGCLDRLGGQFAFVAYDLDSRQVLVARDCMGICPLYYAFDGGQLIVASTVQAILDLGRVPTTVDRQAVTDFFIQDSVGWGKTFFESISNLRAGYDLAFAVGEQPRLERFYELGDEYFTPDTTLTESDWVENVREMIHTAVARCMLGDKEVGVYLSGGIDSISVLAILKHLYPDLSIQTFSAGYADVLTGESIGEVDFARKMAAHYGTRHHEVIVTPGQIAASVGSYDLPPSSVIDCVIGHLADRAAGAGVNVALSGEGSDEMFFGYDHYMAAAATLSPGFGRLGEKYYLRGDYAKDLDPSTAVLEDLFLGGGANIDWDRDRKGVFGPGASETLPVRSYIERLRREVDDAAPDAELDKSLIYIDYAQKVPDNLLRRAEGPSMGGGVEMRFPFLWDDLIRMMYRMPMATRIGDGSTKYILRKVMADLLPAEALARPKSPFGLPAARRMHFKGAGLDFKKPALKHFFNKNFDAMSAAVLEGRYLGLELFNMDFVSGLVRAQADAETCSFNNFLWKIWNFSAWYDRWIKN